jgi:hypothetical protein
VPVSKTTPEGQQQQAQLKPGKGLHAPWGRFVNALGIDNMAEHGGDDGKSPMSLIIADNEGTISIDEELLTNLFGKPTKDNFGTKWCVKSFETTDGKQFKVHFVLKGDGNWFIDMREWYI